MREGWAVCGRKTVSVTWPGQEVTEDPEDSPRTPWMRTRRRGSSNSERRVRRGAPGRERTGAEREERVGMSGREQQGGRVLESLLGGAG